MPLFINSKDIPKAKAKLKPKLGKPVLPSKKAEMDLRRKMSELWSQVLFPATDRIQQLIRDKAPLGRIAEEIESTLRWAEGHYAMVSANLIDRWKASVDEDTRAQMSLSISKATGLDLTYIWDSEEVKNALALSVLESTALIRSIPGQHLGKVARAVSDNFAGRRLPEGRSLLQEIMHIGTVSKKRAKLIARDQTSKLTGALNQTRQQSIGIEEYIWRTVRDERVVGNPNGLYPDGNNTHGNHYSREGQKFRWDTPPPDGHPGTAIQCRCHAQPIIDVAKLLKLAEEI